MEGAKLYQSCVNSHIWLMHLVWIVQLLKAETLLRAKMSKSFHGPLMHEKTSYKAFLISKCVVQSGTECFNSIPLKT